jgi:hypothetical protein
MWGEREREMIIFRTSVNNGILNSWDENDSTEKEVGKTEKSIRKEGNGA